MKKNRFFPTALALYFSYFIHGIGVSILGQYKPEFASKWGASIGADGNINVGIVVAVVAALGLGRLISLPFAGPMSDKFGRRTNGIIGLILYAMFFVGIVLAPNYQIAYLCAILGGMANSFLDTCVTPSCLEIFKESGDVANMFTKFSISIGQFVLPFMIGFVAARAIGFEYIFYFVAILIVLDAIIICFLPFPVLNSDAEKSSLKDKKKVKMKFTPASIAAITIGFTATMTFQLWLNCNQELGSLYGLEDTSKIQSFYALGTIVAILVTAVLVKKFIKPVTVLIVYPTISIVMLLVIYFVETPAITLIGGFVLGFSAAGGVLQLAVSTANNMYPTHKGTITSIVMIASSIGNYIFLNVAAYLTNLGANGPKYVLLLNVAITVVGVLLASYLKASTKDKSMVVTEEVA